jgi:hypothetical protein
MNQSFLVSAIALILGNVAPVQAATITLTEMDFGGPHAISGTVNDSGTGIVQSIDPLFGRPWFAEQVVWFDTHSSPLTWSAPAWFSVPFTYTFHLTGNQVAAGLFFDWSASGVPVLTIFDCPISGGGVCTGSSLPMATPPFQGLAPGFTGTTSDDFPTSDTSPVPVPAAVWMFGPGLLGLIGIGRRKKTA